MELQENPVFRHSVRIHPTSVMRFRDRIGEKTSRENNSPVTEGNPGQLVFPALGRHAVMGRFDGGRMDLDGTGLLLRDLDQRPGRPDWLAGLFTDYHSPNAIGLSMSLLVEQRVLGLARCYGDLILQLAEAAQAVATERLHQALIALGKGWLVRSSCGERRKRIARVSPLSEPLSFWIG